jgi:hypothetical protein
MEFTTIMKVSLTVNPFVAYPEYLYDEIIKRTNPKTIAEEFDTYNLLIDSILYRVTNEEYIYETNLHSKMS